MTGVMTKATKVDGIKGTAVNSEPAGATQTTDSRLRALWEIAVEAQKYNQQLN